MGLSDSQKAVLADMGVDVWLQRDRTKASAASQSIQPQTDEKLATDWAALQRSVATCERCELSATRTQTVFGTGDTDARLMLIGEAPGAEEDRQGLPFVGKAGKLLDAMLYAIGLSRENVYICNVLKCRPPDNRNPRPVEVESCASYLEQQINLVSPDIILALGRFSAHRLLETELPVYKMRAGENFLPGTNIPVIVTYHPASLLRNPEQKAQAWEDLCKVSAVLAKDQP